MPFLHWILKDFVVDLKKCQQGDCIKHYQTDCCVMQHVSSKIIVIKKIPITWLNLKQSAGLLEILTKLLSTERPSHLTWLCWYVHASHQWQNFSMRVPKGMSVVIVKHKTVVLGENSVAKLTFKRVWDSTLLNDLDSSWYMPDGLCTNLSEEHGGLQKYLIFFFWDWTMMSYTPLCVAVVDKNSRQISSV